MTSVVLRDVALFLRYRIIAVRWLGKMRRKLTSLPRRRADAMPPIFRTDEAAALRRTGYATGPKIAARPLSAIQQKYGERASAVVPNERGHPFVNLWRPEDIDSDDPVFRFALSPAILNVAHDYFDGRFQFETIQVLYSFPTDGLLRESQKWHKDYGDSKSLHAIAYVYDVRDDACGPFTFVDREATKRIAPLPYIRRIDDERFARELGDAPIHSFYGDAGTSVLVDPSNCYHYGSRCKKPRMAIFVTFNSETPYAPLRSALDGHEGLAAKEAARVRPDLDPAYLRRIFHAA